MTKARARILRIDFRADGSAVILWSDDQVVVWPAEQVRGMMRRKGYCRERWHGEMECARCAVRKAWHAYYPIEPPGPRHGYGTTFGLRNGAAALAAAMAFIGCLPPTQCAPCEQPLPQTTIGVNVCMKTNAAGDCMWWVSR